MRKFFKNPDFSLTKFVLTIVFTIVIPAFMLYAMNTKTSGVWRAGSDLSWLWILGEAALAVIAVGWIIETAPKNPKFIAVASALLGVIVTTTVILNWKSVVGAFTGKGISLGILAYAVLMVGFAFYVGHNMTRNKAKEHTNTPEGGAS